MSKQRFFNNVAVIATVLIGGYSNAMSTDIDDLDKKVMPISPVLRAGASLIGGIAGETVVSVVEQVWEKGGHRPAGTWLKQGPLPGTGTHRPVSVWLKQGNHRSVWEWLNGVPSRNTK